MFEILATLGIGTLAGNIAQNVTGNILDRHLCDLTWDQRGATCQGYLPGFDSLLVSVEQRR